MKKQIQPKRERRMTPEQRAQRLNQAIFGVLAVIIVLSMLVSLIRW